MLALLTTLIVLFSLNGDALLKHPDLMVLISVPLLVSFGIVVGINLLATRFTGLQYPEGIITVLIGSSSHFEIAIATAVSLYGLGSQAALGTTMGLFWEVPVMLGLVYLGKKLNDRGFWKRTPFTEMTTNEQSLNTPKKFGDPMKKRFYFYAPITLPGPKWQRD
jgi:ACR3 family arsenite transporter